MKQIKFSFLLICLLLLNSCKKELVEIPESNKPIFTASGTIGADTVSFVVGDDASIFNTLIEKWNGVDYFNGFLTNEDLKIELGLFNGDNDFLNVNFEEILSSSNFPFAELSQKPVFEISKENFQNHENIKEIKWKIDGIYAGTNNLCITNPGKYNICAQVNYFNQVPEEICNEIIVGFVENANFELEYLLDENKQLSTWIDIESNTEIATIKWYMNDELVSENVNLQALINSKLNTIKAEITFTNGAKRTRSILVDGTNSQGSIEDFTQFQQNTSSLWDYKLKLVIHQNNDEFSSLNINNDSASFKINSIAYLGNDINNKPIYIFSGNLTAKTKSKITNEILNVNLDLSWGLSID
ncbi:MAG: hypothetical protein V4622_10920 [Bacteroidota bacterium]